MRSSVSVDIDAPPERVWAAMEDTEAWPQWTQSVTSATRLDAGRFDVGSRVRIKQPRLPPVVWTVDQLRRGEFFTWVAGVAGFRTVAEHRVQPTPTGSLVTLSIDQHGVIGELFARMTAGLTQRYLRLESSGLKRRCEEPPA